MKKIFYLAAAMTIAMFVSCDKEGGKGGNDTDATKVTVAADALVLHLPFEDGSVAVGEGVTYDKKVGKADFVTGFIGKAYSNTSGDAATEAYLKYNLAAKNCIKDLTSFTFSAWLKRPALGSGAFFSVNGGVDSFWWCTMQLYYDNAITDDTGAVAEQQFNGRLEIKGVAQWPNTQNVAFTAVDKWYQVVRTYDEETSEWNIYVDGVKLPLVDAEGNPTNIFKVDDKPIGALDFNNDAMNALYVGGWASRIDGKANEGWMTYFNGSIDEVRIYNRALTDQEVGKLWQEEKLINLE